MAFDVNMFVTDILKDVQVDDAQKAVLTAIVSNQTVAKRLEESTLRQSEFSRLTSDYQKKIKDAQTYWESLVAADKRLEDERKALRHKLVDEGIDLNNPDNAANKPQYVSVEELTKLADQAVAYNNAVAKLSMQYYKEFNEILDPDDLRKVSSENGNINIHLAYDKFTQPKREERQKEDFKKQLEQARKEAAEEAIKNFKIPTSETPMDGVVNAALDSLKQKPEDVKSQYGAMAAVQAWKENRTKGNPIPF